MKKVIILNKKEGQTPLEALESFRAKHAEYKDAPMTYAGRLDPMASGVLCVLVGEETKRKEKYLALDKEYEFEVLFGFATDTYDILGKIIGTPRQGLETKDISKELIEKHLKHFMGTFTQTYPAYSSKTVKGKPLFEYARLGQEVDTPTREVEVKRIKLLKIRTVTNKKLLENIEKRIAKVRGDFRQKEIIKTWRKSIIIGHSVFDKNFIARFTVACSTGTYVRSIANSLGAELGIPALAFSIKRTRLGKWRQVG